jgi:biopolymer transport protein ExbD
MKTYEVTLTFMDNGVKRRAIVTVKANSSVEAVNNIMDGFKEQGATNVTIVTNREVK